MRREQTGGLALKKDDEKISLVKVVNIRSFLPGAPLCEPRYKQYVYVGRANRTWGLKGHALANPFVLPRKATRQQRQDCLAKYIKWLMAIPDLDAQLTALRTEIEASGLPLACWCCDWDGVNEPQTECHAVILAKLLMGRSIK